MTEPMKPIDLDAIRARWASRHNRLSLFNGGLKLTHADISDAEALITEVERLREALTEVCDACGPYLTDAAPGETLSGKWAMVFERLSMAVHDARWALGQ